MSAAKPIVYPKRLIEVDLPIRRISIHARREKSIRHGHISTLHIWWARRPLAACRAVICAALWPDPAAENCPPAFVKAAKQAMREWGRSNLKLCSAESMQHFVLASKDPARFDDLENLRALLLDFIADFANWDNSGIREYLDTARALTRAAHESLGGAPGTRPLVVDPFAGGGSIPLEALRVGADAFASDLNPVPVLLNKVVLEYIPKYGRRLASEVRKWGEWIKHEAERELAEFYPKDPDGAIPVAYLWARTIRCEGPGCGAEVPLFRSACLAQKGNKSVSLKLKCNKRTKQIEFDLITGLNSTEQLSGVLTRSSATCPVCGYTTPAAKVRGQFKGREGGAADARLLAVVTAKDGESGRRYRLPIPQDQRGLKHAAKELQKIRSATPEDLPDEPLPYLRSIFNIHLLDVTKWNQLFTPRQQVALVRLTRLVRRLGIEIEKTGDERQLQEAIVACLAITVDRVAAQFSSLSWWQPKGEFVVGTFGRQALGIVWDFAEIRPVRGASGDLDGAIEWVVRVVDGLSDSFIGDATVEKASATAHPLPDNSAAAIITDPPYYDAVPYADLSDFFYVFLKRMLRRTHPALFSDDLTPKAGEVVQLAERNQLYAYKTKEYFEQGMHDALSEARRVTVPSGIAVVVFAHKTTQGWEVMLSSIIRAGWTVTASWPIDTERSVRMRASSSAALASSVHLVCRPRENPDGSVRMGDVGDWRDVLQELPRRIHEWMPRLAVEGVVGADAIFACLGPALEIYSRYSRVERASGEVVILKEYLEHVWAAVSKEALSMIFAGASTEGFESDARLTAMWLWTLAAPAGGGDDSEDEADQDEEDDESGPKKAMSGGYVLEFDAARKIAQGLGATLEALGNLIELSGDKARLLPVSERTRYLFGKEQADAPEAKKKKKSQLDMFSELTAGSDAEVAWGEKAVSKPGQTTLDRIHQGMILFAAGRGEALKRFLVEDGAGQDQRFWRLAQALSALYPATTDEKRWVDGILARKKGLGL
jgi:putative DNA methylase